MICESTPTKSQEKIGKISTCEKEIGQSYNFSRERSYDLRLYSNIPGNRDSVAKNSSMVIENGLTRYPRSGRNLTGTFLPL